MPTPQPTEAPEPRWRTLTPAERQVEYSPSSCTGGSFEPFIAQYESRSEDARRHFDAAGPALQVLRYGDAEAQTLDVVVPDGQAEEGGLHPLLVFIHGGYWQLLSKRESLFAARDCLSEGIAFAAIDYTLAPAATLDEIVAECHRAVGVLRAEASMLGIDPDRIVVCGSSAGAHLSAMLGLGAPDGWRPAAVGLLSGIFELEPLIGTDINAAVGLDVESARRNSPMLAALDGFPPALIAWGDNETSEFKLQSQAFGARLSAAGVPVSTLEVPDRNHFDVVLDLCDDTKPLGAATIALVDDSMGR